MTRATVGRRAWIQLGCIAALVVLGRPADGQQGRPGSADYISVVVGAHGFEKERITALPGQIEILIVNHSGIENISLTIDRAVGAARLKTIPVARHRRDQPDVVQLGAGDYVISVASQPQWKLALRVGPK